MLKVALFCPYQKIALTFADWARFGGASEVVKFERNLGSVDEVALARYCRAENLSDAGELSRAAAID